MKVIVGLGNPGARYDATRHNVGWWAIDRLAYDWNLGPFERTAASLLADGFVDDYLVHLVKPVTWVNRSGAALAPYLDAGEFRLAEDLLVVADDVNLDVGRLRLRPGGGAGGHKGLRSVAGVLGTTDYPRLRIGVGARPEDMDLADWVLSPMAEDDEGEVVALLGELAAAARLWMCEGIEPVMNAYNR
ncbi:MAG: aminoacyl-tRNA hydrolase [Gammaproteobacteria bacterium]|nr:aminoacyl-tRNA hydrolase [Gammaproteobacteria bacterium]MYC51541.1 aminoacyl-tRNA hydrolase [Gammaproteobacteria bacterium]